MSKSDGEVFEVIKGTPPARAGRSDSKYDAVLEKLKTKPHEWVRLYRAPKGAAPKAAHSRRQSLMRVVKRKGMDKEIDAQVRVDEDGIHGIWAIYGKPYT